VASIGSVKALLEEDSMRAVVMTFVLLGAPALAESQYVDVTPTLVLPSMSGRDIYNYFCVSCHGPDGRGDGPVATALRTRPADLRRLSAGSGGTFPTTRVRAVLTEGMPATPAHGTAEMPVWGPIFQALDRTDERARERVENVLAYLVSIQQR
jgi:mono/diheme cytochrome c family protein